MLKTRCCQSLRPSKFDFTDRKFAATIRCYGSRRQRRTAMPAAKENSITFNQSGQTVVAQTNIGTIAGNLNIGAQSSPTEIQKTIGLLKAELAGLDAVSPALR